MNIFKIAWIRYAHDDSCPISEEFLLKLQDRVNISKKNPVYFEHCFHREESGKEFKAEMTILCGTYVKNEVIAGRHVFRSLGDTEKGIVLKAYEQFPDPKVKLARKVHPRSKGAD
jgi:hypothetical protein